jgi:AAA domain
MAHDPQDPNAKSVDDIHERIGSLADTLSTACPPRLPLVDGLFDRGDIVTIAARPGTGKTPFVSQLGLCLASGMPFLDFATHQCPVALIDLETKPARHRALLEQQARALSIDVGALELDVFVRGNPADPNSRELERVLLNATKFGDRFSWLQNLIERRGYGYVAVDTALMFWPVKSSDETAVRLLFKHIRQLCLTPPHAAIAPVLHLRKQDRKGTCPALLDDPHGWTEEMLGSIVWSASADVRLGLEKHGEDQVVFGGYRRGEGELSPRILQCRMSDFDGEPRPVVWERAPADSVAKLLLPPGLAERFLRLPTGDAGRRSMRNQPSVTQRHTPSRGSSITIRRSRGANARESPGVSSTPSLRPSWLANGMAPGSCRRHPSPAPGRVTSCRPTRGIRPHLARATD